MVQYIYHIQMAQQVKFLVLEDEPLAMKRIVSQLQEFGYQIIFSCSSYDEAWKCLENERPDLAIVDINLKSTKEDGTDLAAHINRQYQLPVIYLTSHNDEKTLSKVARTEYSAFVMKPFTPQQIHAAIRLALLKHPDFTSEPEGEVFFHREDIWIRQGKMYKKIILDHIVYIKSQDSISYIYCDDKVYHLAVSLRSFDRQIGHPKIVQVHRKYMVNIERVQAFDLGIHELTVQSNGVNTKILVGPSFRDTIYALFPKLKAD